MSDLTEKIQQKRKEMIELGMKKGFTAEETVKCSQELDAFLNEYVRLHQNKK